MTNAPAKDWVDRLLEDVADDLAETYIADQGYEQAEFPNLSRVADKLLKKRLRSILLTGQAMRFTQRDMCATGKCTHEECIAARAWDAAVKAASDSR